MKSTLGIASCANAKEAKKIANALVGKRLAACCNIIPEIKSVYWWKGRLEKSNEVLLLIKTREQLKAKVRKEIEKMHSYELPVIEFIETELNEKALKWVEKETMNTRV